MTDDATTITAPLPDEVEFTVTKEEAPEEEPKEDEAPEETPEADQDAEAKDADDDSGDEEKAEEDEEKPDTEEKKPRRRSRRDRMIAELRQENAEIKRMLEEMRQPQELKEPREEDFADYNEYQKARDDYSREQGKREVSEEIKRQQVEAAEKQRAEELAVRARAMQEQGKEKYPDFWDVALNSESFDPSEGLSLVILESDMAADVAYYLGSHPDEADRLEAMTQTQAAREIGRIEAKLSARPEPKPKTPSAPAPVKPIGPGKDTPSRSLEDVPYSEYRKRRLKGS